MNLPNPSSTTASPLPSSVAELQASLNAVSQTKQFQWVQDIAAMGDAGLTVLMDFLLAQGQYASTAPVDLVQGKVYQLLMADPSDRAQTFLNTHFPQGILPLTSQQNLDYSLLQSLLAQQDFEAADRLTLQLLCELAGEAAVKRKWVYFSEVDGFPVTDLQTLDNLWRIHSEGRFGFSVQRELWLGVGKDWERLWSRIGWKTGNNWTRYPQEFTWNLTAPKGHLPLTNQLRGVRVMESLMRHPAWTDA